MGLDHPRSRGVYSFRALRSCGSAGSSPLAQGLQGQGRGRQTRQRIIPARAGFTRESPGTCAPRSGSSPLARGLPDRIAQVQGGPGIIPARAGFTPRSATGTPSGRDNPRSRGVYGRYEDGDEQISGSSPLARGLRLGRPRALTCTRIIPARAGFTETMGLTHHFVGGSSPLARGLRRPSIARTPLRGIIPARAGFTYEQGDAHVLPRDHPRSRGVYPPSDPTMPMSPGSSPLARGLQRRRPRDGEYSGIIPARAGFTTRRGMRTPEFRGSSPLARGLQSDISFQFPSTRIIPARAGFTLISFPGSVPWRDHPRSRGVYHAYEPLPRWLGRIIPARAGFTRGRATGTPDRRDHPRSRGVYPCATHGKSRR